MNPQTTLHSRTLAGGYARGRQRLQKLNADRRRFEFILDLWRAWCFRGGSATAAIQLTIIEAGFLCRLVAETNEETPEIHPGDANICDSLKRKFHPTTEETRAVTSRNSKPCPVIGPVVADDAFTKSAIVNRKSHKLCP
jgi:hypothetical protein